MYLVAKYMRLLNFWVTPNVNKPLSILTCNPMSSYWGGWGQTFINGTYEALWGALWSFNARVPCYKIWGVKERC